MQKWVLILDWLCSYTDKEAPQEYLELRSCSDSRFRTERWPEAQSRLELCPPDLEIIMEQSSETLGFHSTPVVATLDSQELDATMRTNAFHTRTRFGHRKICAKPDDDLQLHEITTSLKRTVRQVTSAALHEIRDVARNFLNATSSLSEGEIDHASINNLYIAIDRSKNSIGYPIIPPDYFSTIIECSPLANEAVLQKSLMMSLFHSH